MEKDCLRCGRKYFALRYAQKYCSKECNCFEKGHQAWNLGKSDYLSDEARQAMADNARKVIARETPEQRAKRTFKFRTMPRKPNKLGKTGALDSGWKGEEANYNSKHKWIQKHWHKTGTCEECGETKTPNPLKRLKVATYWHNPLKTYRRERSEWMEVCAVCHYKLDHK